MVRQVGDEESKRKIIEDITSYGWHCVHVMAEGGQVQYSFTVGLYKTYRHPELIIFGLKSNVAHAILSIAAKAAKSGSPLDLAQATDALLTNYLCCFAVVPNSNYDDYVGFARWYYEGNDFPLYQIVWPSKAGLFPWHPQAARSFKEDQPLIAFAPQGA